MVTKHDIWQMLQEFGICENDTVLIHSSMRSTGGVEGGCDALIDACKEYLHDGLLLIPSHTWDRVGKENPVFDVRTTMPCTGALSTVAVNRPDGFRSLHPTHSIVAFGNNAEEFIRGEEYATSPCFPGGCWARLYDVHAKILLIGVTHNRNTFIHAVDEMLDLPDRLSAPISLTVRDRDGNEYPLTFRKHGRTGSEFFDNYKLPLEKLGAVTYGRLGSALVYCCDAFRCAEIIRYLWAKTDHNLCAVREDVPQEYYSSYPK